MKLNIQKNPMNGGQYCIFQKDENYYYYDEKQA